MHFHIAVIIVLISCYSSGGLKNEKCESLFPNPNVEVACYTEPGLDIRFVKKLSGCAFPQEIGTLAAYKCKKFYAPFESKHGGTESEHTLHCGKNGIWKGRSKFLNFRCKEDCGNSVPAAEPLVINGAPTYRALHPWQAMLFVKNGDGGGRSEWAYLCGGSIIRNQVILTAAHCIVGRAELYRVILGGVSTNFSKNSNKTGSQIHLVQRIYISENYDPKKGYQGDIGILQLANPITYTDNVSPICLPNDYSADVSVIRNGVLGQIAGFGFTENGTLPESLREIKLTVKSNSECYNSLHRVLSDSQFCAGSKGGKILQTVCNGDSGNAMTFLSPLHGKFYIHGLVSSSDSDARKGICQKDAVFTRVYPFIFWIRDILEEISGETGREYIQNVPYPYLLEGSEVQLEFFKGLPPEWENRVTKVELRYVQAQFSDILSSLEYAKTIKSIHFGHVVLGSSVPQRRLFLPLLSQFHLDLLRPDFKLDESRTFPMEITESFLKSYLFFDKDYNNRGWIFPELLTLHTDVDLIMHIFKLIRINALRGEVVLNQIAFSNKIFQEFNQNEFNLKTLALHRTEFNISKVSLASSLTSLILSKVNLTEIVDFGYILSRFPVLKHLFLDISTLPNDKLEIGVDELPTMLQFLSVSKSISLVPKTAVHLLDFRSIIFPKEEIINRQEKESENVLVLHNLKTFCCDSCHLDEKVKKNFNMLFPNLSVLFLRTDETVQLAQLLELPSLKSVHLESNELKNLSNFDGLENFLGRHSLDYPGIRLYRAGNSWRSKQVSQTGSQRAQFQCSAGKYFWVSEDDYISKVRLKSFEKEAFRSKKYVFHGELYTPGHEVAGGKVQFPVIPPEIQKVLNSIELKDVEVTSRVLVHSIEKCASLKSMSLLNTEVIGNGRRYSFTTENLTLVLDSVKFVGFNFEYVYEYVNERLVAGVVPFQHVGRFKESSASNTLSRLLRNISSARLEETSATMFTFDSNVAEVQSCTSHIRRLITSLPDSHPLKQTLENLKRIQAAYKGGILPSEWELPGLQILDQNLIERFYTDSFAQFFGKLGIIQYLVKRYGKYISLASLSLTASQNEARTFPPIQTIALSLIRDKYNNNTFHN